MARQRGTSVSGQWPAPRKDGKSYLIYSRRREIVAQPFDAKRLELSGEPTRLAQTQDFLRANSFASVSESRRNWK